MLNLPSEWIKRTRRHQRQATMVAIIGTGMVAMSLCQLLSLPIVLSIAAMVIGMIAVTAGLYYKFRRIGRTQRRVLRDCQSKKF